MEEILSSANMSFGMYPGLSQGAYNAIETYGTDAQKALYLPKLAGGTWSGSMCLTEPQWGTEPGLIRTRGGRTGAGGNRSTGARTYTSPGEPALRETTVNLAQNRKSPYL